MNWLRVLRWVGATLVLLLLLAVILASAIWLYFHPTVTRSPLMTYGERNGQPLWFEVVKPAQANGRGVLLLVSGGWKSGTNAFHPWMAASLLRRGYTVIPIYHVPQPKATVMEIIDDMNRAVRVVRHRAAEFGIDPQRLAVTGGSAGGHLSLMLATRGGPGPSTATDPVERESSAVQAVAIFYPVTDLLNLGPSTENLGDGGPPKSFVKAFGPNSTNLTLWKQIGRDTSPIYFVRSNLPPTLIYHGDADTLVPLEQSQRYQAEARTHGSMVELVVHPGGAHGWLSMLWDLRAFADWFDRHL